MQVLVKDIYSIMIQARDAYSFTNDDGEKVELPAVVARDGLVVICDFEEYTIPLYLPEHFDTKKHEIKPGFYLDVTCPGLSSLKPQQIKNVNRVLPTVKK